MALWLQVYPAGLRLAGSTVQQDTLDYRSARYVYSGARPLVGWKRQEPNLREAQLCYSDNLRRQLSVEHRNRRKRRIILYTDIPPRVAPTKPYDKRFPHRVALTVVEANPKVPRIPDR